MQYSHNNKNWVFTQCLFSCRPAAPSNNWLISIYLLLHWPTMGWVTKCQIPIPYIQLIRIVLLFGGGNLIFFDIWNENQLLKGQACLRCLMESNKISWYKKLNTMLLTWNEAKENFFQMQYILNEDSWKIYWKYQTSFMFKWLNL